MTEFNGLYNGPEMVLANEWLDKREPARGGESRDRCRATYMWPAGAWPAVFLFLKTEGKTI